MKRLKGDRKTDIHPLLRRLPWLLLLPLGLILPCLADHSPGLVENLFSRGLFPIVNGALGTITGWFSFSLAEILLYTTAIILPLWLLIQLLRCVSGKRGWKKLIHSLLSLAIAAGVLLNTFYFTWGFNYFRPTLSELMQLSVRERPVEQLNELCEQLLEKALVLREQVAEDENGVFTLPDGYRASFEQIPQAYQKLGEKHSLFARSVPIAKGVFASQLMSYTGISGIFIPFTAEANVNVDQPALLLLSAAAHETAHFIGIAPENEANFTAYLACTASDDPAIAYSGVMLALINSANQLYSADAEAFGLLRSRYSDGMLRDLRDYSAYWDSFEGPVEETMSQMNDQYLKFNQQQSGIKSYGEMVDLLLAYSFE